MELGTSLLHRIVLHLPIATMACAIFFCLRLAARYRAKGGGLHLLWWGIGMATYGVGTATEAWTTLFGWHPLVFRLWYVTGAFLGGYPLAQGSIYFLMPRRFAHLSALLASSFILLGSVFVFLTPLDLSLVEAHRLSGRVIEWRWIRLLSPFINLYSVAFLAGGAAVSALRYRRAAALRHRYVGNILIAIGAILPGIGGAMTRAGYVEVLYVTELLGLLLIYAGYRLNIAGRSEARPDGASELVPATRHATTGLLLALLLAGTGAVPAAAQEDEPASEEREEGVEAAAEPAPETLPTFYEQTTVTATGHEADVLETATPVTVLGRQEIERRAPDNAADLLREEAGVDVNGVGPNQTRPVIRGQRGLRVLFLADGLRMNNPRRQSDFGEIPGLIGIDSVERVEVVRGPASVLYGSDAIGGVLNLITRGPAGEGLRGGVDLGYAEAAEGFAGHGAVSGRGERAAFHLDASYRDFDDYEAPDGSFGEITLEESTPVLDTGLTDDSLAGTLLYDLGPGHQLSFKLSRYRADETGFGLVEPEAIGDASGTRIRILYPFQDFDRYTLGYVGSDVGAALADVVEARLYFQDNERELANDIDVVVPQEVGELVIAADTLNFTDLETWGTRLEARKGLADRHLLTYGVEGYRDDSFNTDFSTTAITLVLPFPPFEIPIVEFTDDRANAPNAENESWGAFAQAELAATDRFAVTAGARYQSVETRAEPTAGWDIAGLDFDDDATVGSVSLLYQVTEELRLYGSFGTAFRAPNIIERLFNGPTPEGGGFQILNPDLDSETSENFDLGVKYRRANALFELTLFRNDIEDGIVQHFLTAEEIAALPPDLQEEIEVTGAGFVVQQRNADRLRYEGLEASVGYRAPWDLSLGANYTYLDADRLDSPNPPTGDTYSNKLNAFARWEPAARPFWVEYRLRHNGDDDLALQPGEPVPVVGATLPSFTVHVLAGGWTFLERDRQSHELLLRVENATDELYSESSNATFFRPEPGRDVRVTYRLRL